jgi:segregation and condensation protein A
MPDAPTHNAGTQAGDPQPDGCADCHADDRADDRADYRVELDNYSGPLDLLLFLVRKHEIDLHDIPIARLTEQYLAYLSRMKRIDLEVAGEFLVMAATLLEIKSRMLLPADQQTEGESDNAAEEQWTDPRYELVQQLLAYKRFRDAAGQLEQRLATWEQRLPARAAEPSQRRGGAGDDARQEGDDHDDVPAAPLELELEDVSVLDLCEAFARVLDSIGGRTHHEVLYDDTPIALHAEDILDRLTRDAPESGMDLQTIFQGRGRSEAIGLFLAMLELVRRRQVRATQDDSGRIHLIATGIAPEEASDDTRMSDDSLEALQRWRDPRTGEVDYDWPDEQARRRARRRAELRDKRQFGPHGPSDDDIDMDLDLDAGADDMLDVHDEADHAPHAADADADIDVHDADATPPK